MKDFHFYAPTEMAFGRTSENELVGLIKKYTAGVTPKVLVHYGGSSAKRSGLLDRSLAALDAAGIAHVELGGVQPNPRLSLVEEGVALCRREGLNFILAIGGGSVIDSAKAIGYGVCYDGPVWDLWIGKAAPKAVLPLGCIVTLPAAGSEMSDCSVITNEETQQKLGLSIDLALAKFAIMNPELTMTLPWYQTACGAVDIMMHTMERYFTKDTDMLVHTAMSEALIRTVRLSADALKETPDDYQHRAAMMWASSWAHNDLTGSRNTADFATHKMEHEVSALFDVAHGAGLAALWPSWARYVMEEDVNRFVDFAVKVMDVTPDPENPRLTAEKGIQAMEKCYLHWGMPINLPQLLGRKVTDEEIKLMATKCTKNDTFAPGYFKPLKCCDVEAIFNLANKD